jgi:hypothetical protein
MQRMVRRECGRSLISSYDSFIPMCGDYQCLSFWYWRCKSNTVNMADLQGGFMLVRFNNEDGSHGYEMIDFRETMPAAGNETVRILKPAVIRSDMVDVLAIWNEPDQVDRRRSGSGSTRRDERWVSLYRLELH